MRFTERVGGEFRFETFNLFNQAKFCESHGTRPAPGFGTMGQITATIGGPRTIQMAYRIKF